MDFQTEYDQLTKTIDDTLTSQVSSSSTWMNVPGSLVKAVSSPAGYVWGYNTNNSVFVCQLPCTGNWQDVGISSFGGTVIDDIAVDYTNVYVLTTGTSGNKILLVNIASNKGQWNTLNLPFAATKIFSTSLYLWAQDASNNKQKCAKPCTTSNWIVSPENKVQITSSSYSELYGKDASGNAFKTDENITTGWAPIQGFANNTWQSIIGQGGKTDIYGVDMKSQVYSCGETCAFEDDVTPVDTQGYAPINLSSDPESKGLWMTTTTSGDKGNIFTRIDNPDYSSIQKIIDPLDDQRDKIAKTVEKDYSQQTNTMTTNKQIESVVNFFTKHFGYTKQVSDQTIKDSSLLNEQIQTSQQQIDKIDDVIPKIITLIITLVAVAGIYLLGEPLLGSYVHIAAVVAFTVGLFFTIYY
jgi:cell division protein FtsB